MDLPHESTFYTHTFYNYFPTFYCIQIGMDVNIVNRTCNFVKRLLCAFKCEQTDYSEEKSNHYLKLILLSLC